ncbi:MAG: 16S rRNA (guanine(527)-N(7))-methyltransferase RsmG [Pseudomonadota bacterium]|nr:16S rRNA (guanine(527)-N(7))-methyltransferase RsmG [Pseudomonadota bacterium]
MSGMRPDPDLGVLRERLAVGLERLGLTADAQQRDRLIAFLKLLGRWNQAYSLTAVRDPGEMVPRHLLDSLSVSAYLFGETILDVGTGAGLPGLPLAVMAPQRVFHLLDSNGKKTRFVRQAVIELGLNNVTVIQARMESYLPTRKFATIISRAVASLPELVRATGRLLDRPARLLVMKGREPEIALHNLEPYPDAVRVHRLQVPFLDGERHLIEIHYD